METNKTVDELELEYAVKQRNFEIDLHWKRGWFFGALILAEIAAFYALKTNEKPLFPPVILAYITVISALAQCLMNRGSKYWQERWEFITMNREAAQGVQLTRTKTFEGDDLKAWLERKFELSSPNEWFFIMTSFLNKSENALTISRRFSVSKLTFLVWDLICICAFLCWLNESIMLFSFSVDWIYTVKLSIFYLTTGIYIFCFWTNGKVYEPYDKQIKDMSKEDLDKISEMYLSNTIDSSFFKDLK